MSFFKNNTSTTLTASSYFLGQRLKAKDILGLSATGSRAYTLEPEAGGIAYVFRYGVVVFFGTGAQHEADVITKTLGPHIVNPSDRTEMEQAGVIIDPEAGDKVTFEHISLRELTPERLEIISDILAKSSVLSHYERRVSEVFDILEPMANTLQAGVYPTAKRSREYLKHIGLALAMQRNIVGQVEISDKPEILWDQPPELNRFYARLEDEYELIERHAAIKEKLEIIHHTAETLVDLLQTRQSLRVEWYIVILIVLEICLTMGEKFLGF